MYTNKHKKINKESAILKLFLIFNLIFVTFYIFNYKIIFNSDSATANLLAREQVREVSFFPRNWVYVQEVWVLFINNIIIPFGYIFNDALFIRTVVVFLQTGILLIVVFYFFRKQLLASAYGVYFASILVFSGVSSAFLEQFYGQAGYGNVFLWIILSISLLNFLNQNIDNINKKWIVSLFSLLLITFSLGIMGIRYILTLYFPIITSYSIYYIIEYMQNRLSGKRSRKEMKLTIMVYLFVIISLFAGLAVQKIILQHVGFLKGLSNLLYSSPEEISNNLHIYIYGFLDIFAALPPKGVPFLSITGIIASYRFVFLIILLAFIPVYLLIIYNKLNKYSKILLLFYLSSFISTTYVYIFGTMATNDFGSARYFLVLLGLSFILFGIVIENIFSIYKRKIIIYLGLIMLIPYLISSFYVVINNIYYIDLSSKKIEKKQNEHQGIMDFLVENNLRFGYASYWNAGVITVLSNYDIEVAPVHIREMVPFYHLSSKKWYQADYYKGNSFLLLRENEFEIIDKETLHKHLGSPIKILNYNNYKVLIYDFNISEKLPEWPMSKSFTQIAFGSELPSFNGEINGEFMEFQSKDGIATYGPYFNLEKGKYRATLYYLSKVPEEQIGSWDIFLTFDKSTEVIDKGVLNSENEKIERLITVDSNALFEFRTFGNGKGSFLIKKVELEKLE